MASMARCNYEKALRTEKLHHTPRSQAPGHSLAKVLPVCGSAPAAGSGDRGKQEQLQELGVLEGRDVMEHKSHAPQSTCVLCDICLLAPGSALPERLQLGSDLHLGPGRLLARKTVAGQEKEP